MITDTAHKTLYVVNDTHFSSAADSGTRIFSHTPNLFESFVTDVNYRMPDAVLHLGDMCQIPNEWDICTPLWASVDIDIPKHITIGNHDLDDKSASELEVLLGYESKPLNAGSRFNQTFALSDYLRIVMIDSTFDGSDNHSNGFSNIRIHTDSVAWLEDILLNSTEDNIVIATHCMPHLSYFDSTQRTTIKNMIDAVLSTRPSLKVSWICGHHHVLSVETYTNMGSNQKGYLLPALVENSNGRYTIIKIAAAGILSVGRVDIPYTG